MGELRLILWPPRYVVARLSAVPAGLEAGDPTAPPTCLVVGNGEVTLIAPEEVLAGHRDLVEEISEGWRALTVDAVFPLDAVGVLAAISRPLAEARVPVMAFSSHATDHLLVPEALLGRALTALNQVRLEPIPAAGQAR